MTTPRKLTIAAVALLVCGVAVVLVSKQTSRPVTVTLAIQGYTTNAQSIFAYVSVSNAGTHPLRFDLSSEIRPDLGYEPIPRIGKEAWNVSLSRGLHVPPNCVGTGMVQV